MDHRYKKFLTLVETGSFSAAAKQLHVSQPAITIAIASLELKLGKKLLVRNKHKVELTPDGEVVLSTAKKINKEVANMWALLQSNNSSVTHVGFIDSIAHLLYTSPKQKKLLSNIEVMVDNSVRILQELGDKHIEFGLITGQTAKLPEDFIIHKLNDEPFVFVTSPNRAPKKAVTEITDWLAFNQASTTYSHFVNQFIKNELHVSPIFYSTSLELLKDMAKAGNGTALLPRHFVANELSSGTLQIVKTKPMYRPIWMVSRRTDKRPKLLVSLTKQINTLLSYY